VTSKKPWNLSPTRAEENGKRRREKRTTHEGRGGEGSRRGTWVAGKAVEEIVPRIKHFTGQLGGKGGGEKEKLPTWRTAWS